jgi:LysR family transcriptional activator of nhaA
MAHDDLTASGRVKKIGTCNGVYEHFYAIGTEKKVQHPLVLQVLQAHRHAVSD